MPDYRETAANLLNGNLRVISFYQSQYDAENVVIRALYDGCPVEKRLTTLDDYQPTDVAVVMGVYKKHVPASFRRGFVLQQQKALGLDSLILETGYINRGDKPDNHYALGWNGLNGRADFKNKKSPDDRAKKLGVELKPYKYGESIILCGQVPWDASVDFTDHQNWLIEAADNLNAISQRRVIYRPHPKGPQAPLDGCEFSTRPLVEDLQGAHCVVTFNSNSGVESLIEGVPVFAFDRGSMVYPIANRSWLRIEAPEYPDRTQWLNDICYAQWTPEEMSSGEAWEHIGHRASTTFS